jgi:2-keto-3-deoxygluconate permease
VVLGNIDHDLREFLGRSAATLVPFFAFALGATLDLHRVWQAGLLGVALALAVLMVSGVALIVADRLAGGTGTAGIATLPPRETDRRAGHCGGGQPGLCRAAGPATILVAACVIVTALTVPSGTVWWVGRVRWKMVQPG